MKERKTATMTCTRCRGKRIRVETMKEYHDDGLIGLPGVVVLDAARKYVCEDCGEENGISIDAYRFEGIESIFDLAARTKLQEVA